MADQTTMTLKDKIAIIASLVAVSISLVTFFRDQIFGQHILRAAVVAIEEPTGKLQADILIINPGKHVETLYKAQFIFSDDLSKGGGSLGKEIVGPVVLEPGKAAVLRLETTAPNIRALRENGTIRNPQSGIHVGVIFSALTPAGELREGSKIFRFTEFTFRGEIRTGSKPRPGDNSALIDLL